MLSNVNWNASQKHFFRMLGDSKFIDIILLFRNITLLEFEKTPKGRGLIKCTEKKKRHVKYVYKWWRVERVNILFLKNKVRNIKQVGDIMENKEHGKQ